MSFPPIHPSSGAKGPGDEAGVCLQEKLVPKTVEKPKDTPLPPQAPRLIRSPLRRTREEEYKAYGRTFIGSGQHDDYDAMTKLGEGTFGHVLFLSYHT